MALMDWPNLALQFVLGDARKLGSGTQERGERNVPRVEPRPKGVIKVHDEESGAALLDGHADTIPTATDAGAGNRRTRFRLSRANAALPDERLGSICLRDDEVRVGHPLSDDQRRPPGSQVDDAHIAPLPIASEAQHAPAVIRCPVTRGVHVSVDEQLRPRCIPYLLDLESRCLALSPCLRRKAERIDGEDPLDDLHRCRIRCLVRQHQIGWSTCDGSLNHLIRDGLVRPPFSRCAPPRRAPADAPALP